MGTDFSRVRLNPLLNYAGVELKQGGVLLDADANELVDVLDRRLRALASDTLGRATVSSTTPDAFKMSVSAGSLLIGKGRLYVDGLLAENHGAASTDPAKRMFDDLLAEPQFVDPIPYGAQPYLPSAPALPTAGRHLLYLDVWDREVTHLEEPDLVESAVGVETTSRVQTVWQVRALGDEAGGNVTCASPDGELSGWEAVIAPSTGVLTTGTFDVAPVDDPCELPPTGGYRGLENQLYRVEIQDAGQPGTATFKWSRENASVGSRVASMISGTELELATLGRDDVLSFKTGDWVEIIDDVREFSQACGEIRKITVVAATRRIQFTPALPATMLPAAFPDNTFPELGNLRVRRWDQSGRVFRTDPGGTPVEIQNLDAAGSTGVIAIPAADTTILLENGVTVRFASTGARGFRAGDYWVFAARTADASVELLDRSPPRGIHHHYARLGIWDVDAGTITDCRHPWPPGGSVAEDCCCTACVTAESHASGAFTIQDGVNKAAQTGGTVCLGPGQYTLREPVQINGVRSVAIHGQGPATLIAAIGGAFAIRNCLAIGIEKLAILSLGRQPAISVKTAVGLSLRHLLIAVLETNDGRASAVALSGVVAAASISENAIFSSTGILANDPTAPAEEGEQASVLITAALAIDDNVLWCRQRAVTLNGSVFHLLDTRIAGNDVLTCAQTGVSALGQGLSGSSMTISRNTFSIAGSAISCGVDGAWISDNKLVNTANAQAERAGTEVGIALTTGLDRNGSNQCQILANQISGFAQAGILIGSPVRNLIVKLNIIESCGNGILSTADANSASLSIENNHLRDIGPQNVDATGLVVGIGVIRAEAATVAGNSIRGLGVEARSSALRAAILTFGVQRARVESNEVTGVAPTGDFVGRAAGIMVMAPLADFEVAQNRVDRDAVEVNDPSNGDWRALIVLDSDPQVAIARTGMLTTVRVDNARLLVLGGGRPYIATVAGLAATDQQSGAKGSVLGNAFNARGDAPAVDILAGQCLFNNNRVDARINRKIAVTLATPVVTVSANRVTGNEFSIQITRATAKTAAVLGNITTAGISLAGSGLPPPWDALNLRA